MTSVLDKPILIIDGACGTNLQNASIPPDAWEDKEGCNEFLNLSAPDCIRQLHASFVEAGAQVLETNTFGASSIVLAEYGLENDVERINAAAVDHARQAIGDRSGVAVAGSIGPTTKLPSLGHISRDGLYASLHEQALALVQSQVDLLMIETCQDLLQAKTTLLAAMDACEKLGRDLPIIVSVTIERTGTMLVGSDIAAVVATLAPYKLFALGLNCATGPEEMESHIRFLGHQWPGRVSCLPNQGLPEVIDGQTVYPMTPDAYAERMRHFVQDYGVSVVGGCCGTTPGHIRALVSALEGVAPAQREVQT